MHQRVDPSRRDIAARLSGATDTMAELIDDARVWALSRAELLEGIESAYRLATQAHTMALLLAEADQRQLPQELGATSTAAWLTATLRIRSSEARSPTTPRSCRSWTPWLSRSRPPTAPPTLGPAGSGCPTRSSWSRCGVVLGA
jgi:hypothetical protein